MDYDKDSVGEMTLALLYLAMSKNHVGGWASKAHDLGALQRLHQKGWIAEPRVKDFTVEVTAEAVRRAGELFPVVQYVAVQISVPDVRLLRFHRYKHFVPPQEPEGEGRVIAGPQWFPAGA